MSEHAFDEEKLNGEIRKFLKKVGITSQIEIEKSARQALAKGALDAGKPLKARMVLEIEGLGLSHVVEHDLQLS